MLFEFTQTINITYLNCFPMASIVFSCCVSKTYSSSSRCLQDVRLQPFYKVLSYKKLSVPYSSLGQEPLILASKPHAQFIGLFWSLWINQHKTLSIFLLLFPILNVHLLAIVIAVWDNRRCCKNCIRPSFITWPLAVGVTGRGTRNTEVS